MRQFGSDRGYSGHVFNIVDPTLVTHLRHPAWRQVAGVKATTFRLGLLSLDPGCLDDRPPFLDLGRHPTRRR
jgi:hypothetical protein